MASGEELGNALGGLWSSQSWEVLYSPLLHLLLAKKHWVYMRSNNKTSGVIILLHEHCILR